MRKTPALGRLMTAAELCLERRARDLRRIEAELAGLRAEAEELRATGGDAREKLGMRGEAAHLAAAWETLREGRLSDLGRRAAELAASREEARAEVARACGRIAAVRRLMG